MMRSFIPSWLLVAAALLSGCGGSSPPDAPAAEHAEEAAPSRRVPIPALVRRNLGITFAKAERRTVERKRRYPGRFESPPEAQREWRAPTAGRVRLLVTELSSVEQGQPLFELDAPRLRELHRALADAEAVAQEAQAQLDGLPAFREAHEIHETVLKEAIAVRETQVRTLEALAAEGGGRSTDLANARAALMGARVDLAETREKDADLMSKEREVTARLLGARERSLLIRREILGLQRGFDPTRGAVSTADPVDPSSTLVMRSDGPGRVLKLPVAQGAWVDEGDLIVAVLDPSKVRFRAAAPQGDFPQLTEATHARILPPTVDAAPDEAKARVQIAIVASADARTLDLIAEPERTAPWMRPGMIGFVEVLQQDAGVTLAIPARALLQDGLDLILFRRDPANPDVAIRLEGDTGVNDGRYAEILSGLREGDEVVLDGAFQLLLATSETASKGGHFHADGSFHADEGGKD